MVLQLLHVILDRDGVLNQEAPGGYVTSPEQLIWLPGSLDALQVLAESGIRLSIATNQSCVGRGIIDQPTLDLIHQKLISDAGRRGIAFGGVYSCPHGPDDGCVCRKPLPGLIETAIRDSGISRAKTLFIGDAARDLQAGKAAGVTVWLVRTGKGRQTENALHQRRIKNIDPENILVFDDLSKASIAIRSNKPPSSFFFGKITK